MTVCIAFAFPLFSPVPLELSWQDIIYIGMPQVELNFNRGWYYVWKGLQVNENEEGRMLDLLLNVTHSSSHHT